MASKQLQIEDSENALVLAISCHQKSTKLAWELNRTLGCTLQAGDNMVEPIYFIPDISGYAYFSWRDNTQRVTFHLVGNHGKSGWLISSMNHFDYFFVVTGLYDELNIESIVDKIKNIQSVLTAIQVTPPTAKCLKK